MGTFLASRRNQVIVAVAAILLIVASVVAYNLVRGGTPKIGVTQTGTGSVASPSPSATTSPSPDVSPPPSLAPTPSPVPSSAPSAEASAAVPATTAPALTIEHHQLDAPAGVHADPSPRFGSSGPCEATWADTDWTIDSGDCGLYSIRGTTQDGSVAFVIEHKAVGGNTARRVYLMAGADSWHIRLAAYDDDGTKYSKIAVKKAQVAGDAFPEVVVGFRIAGPAQSLVYDIVEMRAAQALEVAATRSLSGGASANIEIDSISDMQPQPDPTAPSYFLHSVIGFSGGAFRVTDSGHAPGRGPGNLAEPP